MNNLKDFDKIYVFVSGGIDSTYLYDKLKRFYKDKIYPINCFNPFETNKTLIQIKKNDKNFITLKSNKLKLRYKDYIIKAFLNIPNAITKLTLYNKYDKKTNFGCCYFIKHKALYQCKKLNNENVVFINGIKASDGKQRRIFLSQLRKRNTFFNINKRINCLIGYPFRDFKKYSFPKIVLNNLKKKYPYISKSGCYFCPVLVMFDIKSSNRYIPSKILAKKLNIDVDLIYKNFNYLNENFCSGNKNFKINFKAKKSIWNKINKE